MVYVFCRVRCFYEDLDCFVWGVGYMIFVCCCGDLYCGCVGEKFLVVQVVLIDQVVVCDLDFCVVCYLCFQEIVVQFVVDDYFGYWVMLEFGMDWKVCVRCIDWKWVKVFNEDIGFNEFYWMG